MIMQNQVHKVRQLPNRVLYVVFLLATIFFIASKDFNTAVIFGGIGLVFDPFDQSRAFGARPIWQKVWLILHLALVLGILVISISQ